MEKTATIGIERHLATGIPGNTPMVRKYLYGIIGAEEPATFGVSGFPPSPTEVYTVVNQGLGCVVSGYQGENFAALDRGNQIRCLIAHQEVIERVMKGHTVLPIKFGTLVEGDDAVRQIIEQGHGRLTQTLKQIADSVEMEVVATWDLKEVLESIGRTDEILRIKESIANKPAAATVEQRIQAGRLVKQCLDRRRNQIQDHITALLGVMAVNVQPNALLADEMVMNVAFMIPKDRQYDFDQWVRALDSTFHDELKFRIIGPLPPYSFSTVMVTRPSVEKIEAARRLLRLGNDVSETEVKETYRRLAAQYHPDARPGDQRAEELFVRLREAFVLLKSYCHGQRNGVVGNENGRRYSLLPEDVHKAFLVEIGRPAVIEA